MQLKKEEIDKWLAHPLTKDLLKTLGADIEALDSRWRPEVGDSMETIALNQSYRMGQIDYAATMQHHIEITTRENHQEGEKNEQDRD